MADRTAWNYESNLSWNGIEQEENKNGIWFISGNFAEGKADRRQLSDGHDRGGLQGSADGSGRILF